MRGRCSGARMSCGPARSRSLERKARQLTGRSAVAAAARRPQRVCACSWRTAKPMSSSPIARTREQAVEESCRRSRSVRLPDNLRVGALYGLAVRRDASSAGGGVCRLSCSRRQDSARSRNSASTRREGAPRDDRCGVVAIVDGRCRGRARKRRSPTRPAARSRFPRTSRKVYAAGPPASVFVLALAPDKLAGWTRALRPGRDSVPAAGSRAACPNSAASPDAATRPTSRS